MIIGLLVENSPDFIAQTFACWERGDIVVPMRSRDDGYRERTARISEVIAPAPGSGWLDAHHEPRTDETAAQILFTSGTEGDPKGVVLSHRNLADVVRRLNAAMRVTSEIREYVGVPVSHSFGFARCRAVLAAGGRAFLPARGFNPLEINTMLETGEINAISAVPSLWRILLHTQAITARAAASVRWIEIGSQSMTAAEKLSLRTLFANAIIVQHYGLTEASRSTFLDVHSAPANHLDSVGRPTGEVQVRIAADGRIMIRGPNVASRVPIQQSAIDPRDAEGWLTTDDLGELRDGYLYYLGRADDVINCGGLKLAPDILEAEVRTALGGGEVGVCRVPDKMRGDGILVAVTHEMRATDAEIIEAVAQAARRNGVDAEGATHLLRVSALPRTENGKLRRSALANLFTPASGAADPPEAHDVANLRAQLGTILGVNTIRARDTFVSVGGDSLRFIQAGVVLERALGFLPVNWENRPFGELEALRPERRGLSQLEPSILVRAIAIVAVVVNHSHVLDSQLVIDGAAFLLLIASGYNFARFQLQRVIEFGRARLALTSVPRIVVPTLIVLVVIQLDERHFAPSALLFYENFINDPDVLSFWFIEIYLQLHLLVAVALMSRWVRSALRDQAYVVSLAAVLVSALATFIVPQFWNTDHLRNLVPHFAMWFFVVGWCILFAKRPWERWLTSGLVIALAAAQYPVASKAMWILIGGLYLHLAPPLRLPATLARAVGTLASASLFIYVSHLPLLGPVSRRIPWAGKVGAVIVALVAGVIFWFCVDRAWRLGRRFVGPRLALERG